MKTTIRDFQPSDYPKIIALWHDAGLPCRPRGRDSRENIERQVASDNCILLVAERDGEVIGSVLGTHDGRKGWINRLAVRAEDRGDSLGGRLVAEAEQRLSRLGINLFGCLIEVDNQASMRFFEKLGYTRGDVAYYSKRPHPGA